MDHGMQTPSHRALRHSRAQVRRRLAVFPVFLSCAAGLAFLLIKAPWTTSNELHTAADTLCVLLGLLTGIILIQRAHLSRGGFDAYVGLAFLVGALGELTHGFLALGHHHNWHAFQFASVEQAVVGSTTLGRILAGLLLLRAIILHPESRWTRRMRSEVIGIGVLAGVALIVFPCASLAGHFPRFVFAGQLLARPMDLVAALVLLTALIGFGRRYRIHQSVLTWWIALSIGINVIGQAIVVFSTTPHDAAFILAHVCRATGYVIPLSGYLYFQTVVEKEHLIVREALVRSEDRFRAVVLASGDWIWEMDIDFNLTYCSERAEESTGWRPPDLMGRNFLELLSPSDLERTRAQLEYALLSGEAFRNFSATLLHRAGHEIIIDCSGVPVYGGCDQPAFLRGAARDVTQIRMAEKDLIQLLQTNQALLERIPVGVIIVGHDRRIRRVNSMALHMMGYESDEDLIGRLCHEHMCPAERNACPILDLNEPIENEEKDLISKGGEHIPVLKTVLPLRLEGEDVLLEAFVDISGRKKVEEELRQRVVEMSEAQRQLELLLDDATGRESRMVELKREVNHLLEKLDLEPKYEAPRKVAEFLAATTPESPKERRHA